MILASLAATLFLAGLAWQLLIVQLPLLVKVDDFASSARELRLRNTLLMTVPMLVELATALWLVVAVTPVVVVWAATIVYGWQFARLTRGFDGTVVRALMWIQAIRTVCWTVRGGMMLWIAQEHLHIQ